MMLISAWIRARRARASAMSCSCEGFAVDGGGGDKVLLDAPADGALLLGALFGDVGKLLLDADDCEDPGD